MFNVKRNGTTVEITEIPASIPVDVFKRIANEVGANECLVCFSKDSDSYEVTIRCENDHMAATVSWLAFEACEPITDSVDISSIGKRIGVMRVKQRMSVMELEDAIAAPRGSVFRWETGKAVPTDAYIVELAGCFKCEPEWLLYGKETKPTTSQENSIIGKVDQEVVNKAFVGLTDAIDLALGISMKIKGTQLESLDCFKNKINPTYLSSSLQKESQK
ncbi:hypothetical protein D6T51_17655 [Salmonella enterica subsp. enterica serovar Muenchen]|nr:hypothetical protein [Salmonella enterica subsp. enterica serovar Muenchen]EJM3641671.1 hypothetical protein [Salmonella enterica]